MAKIKVTIIGLGNVGKAIMALLSSYSDHELIVNIQEPDKMKSGTVLDFSHTLYIAKKHEIHLNDKDIFENSDFIFHTAGHLVKNDQTRLDIAPLSIDLTYEIFNVVRFKSTPTIIVISNPVDIISYHTWKASGLAPHNILGTGTYVDNIRFKYYIHQYCQVEKTDINTWILGEHGESFVPIFSNSYIRQHPIREELNFEQIRNIIKQTKQAAKTIKSTQGATIYGVSQCAYEIFRSITLKTTMTIPLSVQIPEEWRNRLQCPDVFMSLPIHFNDGDWKVVNNFELDLEEVLELKKAAEVIEQFL